MCFKAGNILLKCVYLTFILHLEAWGLRTKYAVMSAFIVRAGKGLSLRALIVVSIEVK